MKTFSFWRAAVAAACLLSSLLWAGTATAQCHGTIAPYDAWDGLTDWKSQFKTGPSTLSVFDNGNQLLVGGTSSYGLMLLTNPLAPFPSKKEDLSTHQDCTGSSSDCKVIDSAGAADGSYFLLGTNGWGLGAWVFKLSNGTYVPTGHFDQEAVTAVGVHTTGARHLGISKSAMAPLRGPIAADLDANPGSLATALATEAAGGVSQAVSPIVSAGPYIVMNDGANIWVVKADETSIGASVPGLSSGLQTQKIQHIALNNSGGAESMSSFAVVVDPTDSSPTPRVYLFTRWKHILNHTFTFRLHVIDSSGPTLVGEHTPGGMWGMDSNGAGPEIAALTVGGQAVFLGWAADGDSLSGTAPTTLALLSFTPSTMSLPIVTNYDRLQSPLKVVARMAVRAGTNDAQVYVSTDKSLVVLPLTCTGQVTDAGIITPPIDGGTISRPDASTVPPDAGCLSGTACTSADGCQTGKTNCVGGVASCGSLVNKTDGTACGAGGQCQGGQCIVCHEGEACDGPDGCTEGVLSCAGGPTCTSLSPKADGSGCGTNKVCYQSQCVTCVAGGKCTSVDGCQTGKVNCSTGQPACGAPWTNEADGTLCSSTGKCQSGVCSTCSPGAACFSDNHCQKGTIACSGGAVCSGLKNVADGTACPGGLCNAGACIACVANLPCETADGCASGATNCNSGTVKCGNLIFKPNGSACEGGVCSNGICKIPADAGVRRDASIAAGTDAAAPGEDAGTVAKADTGGGQVPAQGCGCQSGIGTAWSALFLLTGATFLRRRR
ncbi:MAG: hypothetical protein QM765_48320 [Myxococcales bacterium]